MNKETLVSCLTVCSQWGIFTIIDFGKEGNVRNRICGVCEFTERISLTNRLICGNSLKSKLYYSCFGPNSPPKEAGDSVNQDEIHHDTAINWGPGLFWRLDTAIPLAPFEISFSKWHGN
ncbi:Hypothetical predicted protein [Octopus vulgaris]|uniref:Uncharacterized protein n=1 Tax=Octopus vulgaris TaxID=6645 RepID=A0AA36B876_OCTVU|nr:Hypothetical predicted protein [Octopus vulgaris]